MFENTKNNHFGHKKGAEIPKKISYWLKSIGAGAVQTSKRVYKVVIGL